MTNDYVSDGWCYNHLLFLIFSFKSSAHRYIYQHVNHIYLIQLSAAYVFDLRDIATVKLNNDMEQNTLLENLF